MSWLAFIQLGIYLILCPLWLFWLGDRDFVRLDISFVVLAAFIAGQYLAWRPRRDKTEFMRYTIPFVIKAGMAFASLGYVYIVLRNGLFDRRQGSEQMAFIYAHLSVVELMLMRVYEETFYPFVILLLLERPGVRRKVPWWLLASLLLAFFFSGVVYSRAKLLMPIIFYLEFFYLPGRANPDLKSGIVKIAGISLATGAILVVIYRAVQFDDIGRYFTTDFLTRLDGLEFVSVLGHHVLIPFWGTKDFMVFANFITAFPFLDGVAAMKAQGLTSSKNYLLKVVLHRGQIDINNTFVTDLYYFGGYPFLFLGAACYGYFCRLFDIRVREGAWLSSRATMAIMMSFGINAVRIEQDFFGMALAVIRDFVIFYIFLYCVLYRSRSDI